MLDFYFLVGGVAVEPLGRCAATSPRCTRAFEVERCLSDMLYVIDSQMSYKNNGIRRKLSCSLERGVLSGITAAKLIK